MARISNCCLLHYRDICSFLVEEKLDAEKKLQDVETNLSNTEDEYAQLKLLYETNIDENRKLAAEFNRLTEDLKAANAAIPIAKEQIELETEALMSDKPPSDEDEGLFYNFFLAFNSSI